MTSGEGLIRWMKFNLVGVAGMLVQLSTLAVLNYLARGHYLLASAIALEAAVLHNFVAHLYFTWRDRRGRMNAGVAWLRFQLSNGAVSLAGNLLLMRLLVARAHLPVLAANLLAIVACGLVNFWLGDQWAFAGARTLPSARQSACGT